MATREEIREAIDTYTDDMCLFPDRSCNALGSGYCSSSEEAYKCLMERLTQIGVVIKVDRELPDIEDLLACACDDYRIVDKRKKWLKEAVYKLWGKHIRKCIADYVAAEPLIGEE